VKRLHSTVFGVLGMPLDGMTHAGRDTFQKTSIFLVVWNKIVKSFQKMFQWLQGLCGRRVSEFCLQLLMYFGSHKCLQAEWQTA